MEIDSSTYNTLIERQKINLGWSRCWVYNDFGIIRCFCCNRYGHMHKDCKDKITCAKCSGSHDINNCTENNLKCVNCMISNDKYKMNLSTNHTAWDSANCETYKRIEKIRNNKFIQ